MNKKIGMSGVTTEPTRSRFRWPAGLTVFFAMCYLAALAAFFDRDAVFYEPFVNAYEQPVATANQVASGPADVAVARKYGPIDQTIIMGT